MKGTPKSVVKKRSKQDDSEGDKIDFGSRKSPRLLLVKHKVEHIESEEDTSTSDFANEIHGKAKRALVLVDSSDESSEGVVTKGHKRRKKKMVKRDVGRINKKQVKKEKKKWLSMSTRSSPLQLFKGIQRLKENQRAAVDKMGFGRLLNFRMDGIPGKIAHFVVDKFDPATMEIKVANANIPVDKESIHRLLGIPCQGIQLHTKADIDPLDVRVEEWKRRYHEQYIPTTKIVEEIDNAEDEDTFFFRLDFIMLFVTVMIECHHQGRCRDNVIKKIDVETKFENIDWCGYILEALKNCKTLWRRSEPKYQFAGPLTILTLLYVDSIECSGIKLDESIDAMSFWTMEKLKTRQKLEIERGGFGLGRYKGLTVPRNTDLMGADDHMNRRKHDEKKAEIQRLLDLMCRTRKKVELGISEIYNEAADDEEMVGIISKYDSLFQRQRKWQKTTQAMGRSFFQGIRKVVDNINSNNFVEEKIADPAKMQHMDIERTGGLENCRWEREELTDTDDEKQNEVGKELGIDGDDQLVGDVGKSVTGAADVNLKRTGGLENCRWQNEEVKDTADEKKKRVGKQIGNAGNEQLVADVGKSVTGAADDMGKNIVSAAGIAGDVLSGGNVVLVDYGDSDDDDTEEECIGLEIVTEQPLNYKDTKEETRAADGVEAMHLEHVPKNTIHGTSKKIEVKELSGAISTPKCTDAKVCEGWVSRKEVSVRRSNAKGVQQEHDVDSEIKASTDSIVQIGASNEVNVKDLPAIKEMESKRRLPECDLGANSAVTHTKAVDLDEPITNEESSVWGFIFEKCPGYHKKDMISKGEATAADFGDKVYYSSDFVFKGKNQMLGKQMLKSMDVGEEVCNFVIDAWVDVLNHKEKQKASDAPRRLFCSTNVIVDWMLKDKKSDDALRLAAFEKKIYGAVYRDPSVADLRGFDLIFFPILECAHYYLIVFDLVNVKINVIDNRASAQKIARLKDNENYFLKHTAYKVKDILVRYLDSKGHQKAESMRSATANMVKTAWATSANGTDCGVFLMRHMEMYMGSDRPFNCGFITKGHMKKNQLGALRKKFVAHMLLSEANLMKDELKKAAGIK